MCDSIFVGLDCRYSHLEKVMPNKARSKAQFRLFKAVESGKAKLPGLTKEKAAEITAGQSQIGLPERAPKALGKRRSWSFR